MANHSEENQSKSGMATASLVLGIVGICTSFIPIINNLSFFLGILALIFAIIELIKKVGKGKAITGLILGILSIVITINLQNTWSNSLNQVSKDLDKATGENTEEVLANDVDVKMGTFEVSKGEYGINETKLVVNVKNKTTEKKSFSIHVEAADSNGSRIAEDYVYANDLTAGQNQSFDIFTYVSSENLDAMQKATFKIVEASAY